jgi:hypothetical protein
MTRYFLVFVSFNQRIHTQKEILTFLVSELTRATHNVAQTWHFQAYEIDAVNIWVNGLLNTKQQGRGCD